MDVGVVDKAMDVAFREVKPYDRRPLLVMRRWEKMKRLRSLEGCKPGLVRWFAGLHLCVCCAWPWSLNPMARSVA